MGAKDVAIHQVDEKGSAQRLGLSQNSIEFYPRFKTF
jgi:hypothetical protein